MTDDEIKSFIREEVKAEVLRIYEHNQEPFRGQDIRDEVARQLKLQQTLPLSEDLERLYKRWIIPPAAWNEQVPKGVGAHVVYAELKTKPEPVVEGA